MGGPTCALCMGLEPKERPRRTCRWPASHWAFRRALTHSAAASPSFTGAAHVVEGQRGKKAHLPDRPEHRFEQALRDLFVRGQAPRTRQLRAVSPGKLREKQRLRRLRCLLRGRLERELDL